jgi:predicted GNAT superfamily acetyltransferase
MSVHSNPVPAARAAAVTLRDARGAELVAGCALLARSLGFSDRDAVPAWLVQTVAGEGGLALGAFAGGRLVGFSFALPTGDGALFSCGLAVDTGWRARGVGRRLKLLQRERALARGVRAIRWTADPLAAPALSLYLGALGARLVAYAPALYASVRPGAADDVVIEWALAGARPPGEPVARVALASGRPAVRRAMTAALARGGVGTDVTVDGGSPYVVFREAA